MPRRGAVFGLSDALGIMPMLCGRLSSECAIACDDASGSPNCDARTHAENQIAEDHAESCSYGYADDHTAADVLTPRLLRFSAHVPPCDT